MRNFPQLDIPFPADKLTASAVRSECGLAVFLTVHEDIELPEQPSA